MRRSSMMRRRPALAASAIAMLVCVVAGVACYGPTEVRVLISTDLPCTTPPLKTTMKVGATIDPTAIVAETTACTARALGDTEIGSIVVVPSGERDARVIIEVTATADGSDTALCGRPETSPQQREQCIVARRSFKFIEHTSRTLPIKLYAACKGIVCGATDTCNKAGECESAEVVGDDETGCIASECAGSDAGGLPDAPPEGPVDEAQTAIDAAEAAVGQSCTQPDGTHALTNVMEATDHLAGNSTQLVWIRPNSDSLRVDVRTIRTKQPSTVSTLFSVVTQTLTTIAADDLGVWVATPSELHRYDLGTTAVDKFELRAVTSIVTTNVSANNGKVTATTTYVATRGNPLDPGATPAVYRIDMPGGVPVVLEKVSSGERLAVAPQSASTLYVHAPANGPLPAAITRYQLPWPGAGGKTSETDAGVLQGMAADPTSLFFFDQTAKNMMRFDDGSSAAAPLYNVSMGGLVAVDASNVFFQQRGAGGGVMRGPKLASSIVAPAPVKVGFDEVYGLVLDDACVYFWGVDNSGILPAATLNAYPKGP